MNALGRGIGYLFCGIGLASIAWGDMLPGLGLVACGLAMWGLNHERTRY